MLRVFQAVQSVAEANAKRKQIQIQSRIPIPIQSRIQIQIQTSPKSKTRKTQKTQKFTQRLKAKAHRIGTGVGAGRRCLAAVLVVRERGESPREQQGNEEPPREQNAGEDGYASARRPSGWGGDFVFLSSSLCPFISMSRRRGPCDFKSTNLSVLNETANLRAF